MKNMIITCLLLLQFMQLSAQQYKSNMPWIDLSENHAIQTVISQGTPLVYNGHPTTLLLEDQKTILCVWSSGHGGKASYMGISNNAGLSWNVQKTPADWQGMSNCPSIYQMTDKKGCQRLFVFCGDPDMGYSYSEDNGKSWSKVKSLHKPCVMAFASIVRLKNGDYMGFYHRGYKDRDQSPLTLWSAVSHDGGLTWDESVKIASVEGRSPCEPCVFRSPNGKRLICIARENNRVGLSLMMYSDDEGKTWSEMKETPWGLTGDRHVVRYTKDGRMVAVFRDMAPNSPTKGHFVAWVGNYKDLVEDTSGQYRIKLLHSYAGSDCGYPGLEILPDGSLLAITYIKYNPGKEKHSIVQVKFKLDETDSMLKNR